jgi:hypothetical protein
MRKLNRLVRLEIAMQSLQEREDERIQQWWKAIAAFEARRKGGVEISPEEQQQFARVYEILDLARARRDKALGIRRKPREEQCASDHG